MKTGFKSECRPEYRLLTESQIKELHRATVDLLWNTGVKVLNGEALELLDNAGCRVGADHIVKIPGGLVEESIASAPSSVRVYNRKGDPAMGLGVFYLLGRLGLEVIHYCHYYIHVEDIFGINFHQVEVADCYVCQFSCLD